MAQLAVRAARRKLRQSPVIQYAGCWSIRKQASLALNMAVTPIISAVKDAGPSF
jgi:hypothetical protein